MTATAAVVGLWVIFIVSWVVAAFWAGRTVADFRMRAQLPLYTSALVAVLLLSIAQLMFPGLRVRLWEENALFDWTMVTLCAIGLGWCWWARIHLGNLWSAGVTRREGHRVIDTGPYSVVRHPMYTGSFLAMFAFAATRARLGAWLMALLLAVIFSCKALLEERFLREELGATYDAYRQRVPMFLPFFRRRPSRR